MREKLLIREAQNLMNGKEEMQWKPITTNCYIKKCRQKMKHSRTGFLARNRRKFLIMPMSIRYIRI